MTGTVGLSWSSCGKNKEGEGFLSLGDLSQAKTLLLLLWGREKLVILTALNHGVVSKKQACLRNASTFQSVPQNRDHWATLWVCWGCGWKKEAKRKDVPEEPQQPNPFPGNIFKGLILKDTHFHIFKMTPLTCCKMCCQKMGLCVDRCLGLVF